MKTIKSKLAVALMAAGLSFSAAAADIKVAYNADPVSLDPHEQLSGGTLQLSHMVFDPLVRFTQDMDFEPRLAESWERIDDITFRFKLRQGVKFHSGNGMTADDVVWTFNRLKSSPDFKAIFEPYTELKKVDDYTVDFVTTKPNPIIFVEWATWGIMDKEWAEANNAVAPQSVTKGDANFATRNANGTGPFKIVSHEADVKTVAEVTYDHLKRQIDRFTEKEHHADQTELADSISR